jgi:hypothetical protein
VWLSSGKNTTWINVKKSTSVCGRRIAISFDYTRTGINKVKMLHLYLWHDLIT